jgi:hypothetical protein
VGFGVVQQPQSGIVVNAHRVNAGSQPTYRGFLTSSTGATPQLNSSTRKNPSFSGFLERVADVPEVPHAVGKLLIVPREKPVSSLDVLAEHRQ